ncbi:MAG: rRNA pseudouridine synthase [Lachnospiraceae bacterium]|nr:rRNA pseudouridine synthase [Lachnospiraceae bacterium]
MNIRLDKYLCQCLNITRTEAKKQIKTGQVSVNSETAKKPEAKINPQKDIISVNHQVLTYEPYVYYMLNKPQGVVSATVDNLHKTVIDLIDENRDDLFPVGRLDIDTEGLLLITNDGQLGHNLTSPNKHVSKVYYSIVDGALKEEHIALFLKGISIGEEKPLKPAKLEILDSTPGKSSCYVTITEGKFHQVKRMFQAIGLRVTFLKRISMGGLTLDETLKPGEYKKLTKEELEALYD